MYKKHIIDHLSRRISHQLMLQESFSSSLDCVFSSHWVVAYILVLPDAAMAARMHPLQVALSV